MQLAECNYDRQLKTDENNGADVDTRKKKKKW